LTDNLISQFGINLSEIFEIVDFYWNNLYDEICSMQILT